MANKPTATERDAELASLRQLLPPGTTIHVITRRLDSRRNVRNLSFLLVAGDKGIACLDFKVASVLRLNRDRQYGGVRVPIDLMHETAREIAHELVVRLSNALHGGNALLFPLRMIDERV